MSYEHERRDSVIKFRAEKELRVRLERVARGQRKRLSEFLREEMWKAVEREEQPQKELTLITGTEGSR